MFQLVAVVMAIGLLAVVMAGGLNYISTDVGVRTETVRQISVSRNAIESGLSAYRLANRGHLPPAEGSESGLDWRAMLDGYVTDNGFKAPDSMQWRLVENSATGEKYLCLEALEDVAISKAVVAALETSAKTSNGKVGTGCPTTEVADHDTLTQPDARASLSIPIVF